MTASELMRELEYVTEYCDGEIMVKVDSYLYTVDEVNADDYELVAFWGEDRPVIVIKLGSQTGGCSTR